MDKVLVVEISGKRPGNYRQRPTEKFKISYPKVIISNNSEGYQTDWQIINVPEDYKEWYINNVKSSENAWYAPMNRSYAIKYAKENGYDYLIQLDDNIVKLEIAYLIKEKGSVKQKRYRAHSSTKMADDFISMLVTVLKNTNAGMAGLQLSGTSCPDSAFLAERYVYSFFGLDLSICPDIFQGDFEDDIEYRLKLAQMGIPAVQVSCLRYGKTSQKKKNDLTGCRKAYQEVGVKRGDHMRKLYGDIYSCGLRSRTNSIMSKEIAGEKIFKHKLKPFKVGVIIYDMEPIKTELKRILRDNKPEVKNKVVWKERRC